MRGKGLALLRASAAFSLAAALLVGVPVLLVQLVGNPLPASLPTVDEIRILLTQTGQGFANLLIGTLAIVIWFVWAQLVVAFIAEVLATLRHVETRRLATFPGIQAFAARLVAAITLAFTLSAGPLLAPAVGALTFDDVHAVATAPVVEPAATQVQAAAAAAPVRAELDGGDGITLLLADHTELWDVADSAYGDGLGWKTIAHANAGIVDSVGAMITAETVVVGPGTELRLPGLVDAEALERFGSVNGRGLGTVETQGFSRHGVEPGDSMWSIAHDRVEDQLDRTPTVQETANYWSQVIDENADVPSGDLDLIFPGDELRLPPVPGGNARADVLHRSHDAAAALDLDGVVDGPADNRNSLAGSVADPKVNDMSLDHHDVAVESFDGAQQAHADREHVVEPGTMSGQVASGEIIGVSDPTTVAGDVLPPPEGRGIQQALGLAALGSVMLSAGVAGAMMRRRDRQRRTKPETHIAPLASVEAAAFEAALRQSAGQARQSTFGDGWRMVPAQAVEAARAQGPLLLHAHDSGQLHAVSVTGDPTSLDRTDLSPSPSRSAEDQAAQSVEAVVPTSLLIGTDADSGEAVFVDIASSGQLSLVGDEHDVSRFIRTAVLDLAVSDRADDLVVIAVDIASELVDLERVTHVASFAQALAHAESSGHAGPESTTAVIVLAANAYAKDHLAITALASLGVGVVAPNLDARLELQISGNQGTILPAGTVVELVAYPDDDYLSVAELVEATSADAMQPASEAPPLEEVVDVVAASSCTVKPGPIEVKVLGSVEVSGAESFSSLKAVDVVAYLAFHRNGADADQIKSWVWPAFQPPTDKAFANVMSRARTALGVDRQGAPYLSRAGSDRTYRLSTEVTTDFDRFRSLVHQADQAPNISSQVAALKMALELIRGVPFTGGGASGFVWADNHVRAQVEFAIDETVHRCADLAIEVGDLETARWAALKGLELGPGCEQCFRRRFLVASAGQNRSELRRAMADLERSAAAELGEPEGVDHISGDLLDLYHQLDQTLMASTT